MEPKQTSRLETLVLNPDSASFFLDGRKILIKGDGLTATREAFQALYDTALADFESRQAPEDRGLLAWLGRLWGKSRPARPGLDPQEIVFGYSAGSVPPPSPARQTRPATPAPPSLHSIFADEGGIHVQWRFSESDGRGARLNQTVEATFALDSEVGRRLEACYGELSILGYEVRNLGSLAPQSPPPTTDAQDPVPSGPKPEPATPAPSSTASEPSPAKPLIFRLHFSSPEFPTRAIVTPVENPDRPEVLVAHERFVRALQVATQESQPSDQRVTFLRCEKGEKGIRVIEIGLGIGADREPARWEEAKAWWERAGRPLAMPPPLPGAIPSPKFVPGGSPLQTGVPVEPSVS